MNLLECLGLEITNFFQLLAVYTISHCIFISWIIHYFLGTKEDHILEYLHLCTYSGQNEFKLVLVQVSLLRMYCHIP